MRMKKCVMKALLTVLFLGSATLALATNEVRVTVDPLDWYWEGSITIESSETIIRGQGKSTVPFNVGPGGGVQQVATGQVGFQGDVMKVWLDPSTVTNPRTGDTYDVPSHSAEIKNPYIGNMSLTTNYPPDTPLTVFMELNKLDGYYEMKFFLSAEDQLVIIESDRCTTNGAEFSNRCFGCELGSFNRLICNQKTVLDSNIVVSSKWMDDCIGNSNGQMVHGSDAPWSCDNFSLENDILHAQCRDSGGQYRDTSIVLADYFAADPRPGSSSTMVCAQ